MPNIVPRLLKETTGETLFDKFVLNFLKSIYLIMRLSLRIALGKKRRDRLYIDRKIGFNSFLNKSMRFLHLHNLVLLKIYVPKYDYRFYCRNNNEDYTFMTGHEDDLIKFFIPKEGDTVVDVGAHIGHYTILSSMRVGMGGKVVSIEAHRGNFDMLNRNVKLNHLSNVVTLNYAVFSKETKINLYLPAEESDFTIYNTVMTDRSGKDGEKFVEVDANTLDNLLQQNGINAEGVNWVKVDVEGAELEVLRGATDVLSKSKNIALLIEVHGSHLYEPIKEFIYGFNFKIEFEKSNEAGDWRHILARKQQKKEPD
jgi:FkbM family methyltransferase